MVVTAFPFAAAIGISFCDETLPGRTIAALWTASYLRRNFRIRCSLGVVPAAIRHFSLRLALFALRLTAADQKRGASSGARSAGTFASALRASSWSVINAPGHQRARSPHQPHCAYQATLRTPGITVRLA